MTGLTWKWRAGDADAGTKMAACGAGAVLGPLLLLLLLRAGPARARVHHLTLKVRSAPPPAPLARPPGALRGAVRPARPRAPPAGRNWSPHVLYFRSAACPDPSFSSFLSELSLCSPPAQPQPARAPPCCAFAVILPLPRTASPESRPAFSGRLFLSRG